MGVKTKRNLNKTKKIKKNKTDSQTQTHYIGHYHETPLFVRDNQHIKKGYRINFDTPKKIFKSLFMMHNESVNIWSHIFGAILVILIICYVVFYISPQYKKQEYRHKFNEQLEKYMTELNNITFIQNLKLNSQQRFKNLKDELELAYNELIQASKQSITKANQTFNTYKTEFEKNFHFTLLKFVNYTENIQKKVIHQVIDNYLNNSFIDNSINKYKNKFLQLAESETYSFVDPAHSPNPYSIPKWPLFIFLISAIICLSFSSLFHLFLSMSDKSYKLFSRFDYAGINILIAGSSFPSVLYGLYCKIDLALFYLFIISVIGIGLFTITLFQFMHTEKYRVFKSLCYGGYGVFLSIPLIHMLILKNLFVDSDQFSFNQGLPIYFCVALSYLGGLYVYTVQCPQRYAPGKYDICGHSHQIWHLCVVSGIIFTYLVSLYTFEERKKNMCI